MAVDGIRRLQPKVAIAQPTRASKSRSIWLWALPAITVSALAVALSGHIPQARAVVGQAQGAASSHAGHAVRQPAAVTNGLVAWYPMDGNLQDQGGNGNNGAVVGGSASYTSGKFAKAYVSSGTQYINVATSPITGNNVTFSAWINPTSKVASSIMQRNSPFFFGYGNPPVPNNTGTVCANFNVGSGWANGVCGATAVPFNTWSLATVTFDGTTERVYFNGVLDGQATNAGSISAISSFQIGGGSGSSFPGSIDDVRAYNRTLSASEIAMMYQGSLPVNCDQTCVGWWKLDELSGTTAKDSLGNGNTGTLTNFTFDGTTNGWTSGKFGNGLLFNGSQSVSLPSLSLTAGITYTAWVKTSTSSNSYYSISKFQDGSGYGFWPIMDNTGRFNVRMDTTGSSNNYGQTPSTLINDGQWHHVAWVYNRTVAQSAVYVDGIAGQYHSIANIPTAYVTNVLGTGSGYVSYIGSLDDVRIYSRALTDYEIYDQYSAGR